MKRDGQPNRPPNWKKRRSTATGPIIALHALQNKTTGAPHCSRGVERSAAAAGRSAHWRSPLRDAANPRQALAFCGHHPRRRRGTCSHPPCSTVHGTKVPLLPPMAAAMAMASCRVKMTGDWRRTDARTASAIITSRIDSLRGRHRHSNECSSTITGGLDRSSDGGSKRHGPGGRHGRGRESGEPGTYTPRGGWNGLVRVASRPHTCPGAKQNCRQDRREMNENVSA
jgi:hypothetical protein